MTENLSNELFELLLVRNEVVLSGLGIFKKKSTFISDNGNPSFSAQLIFDENRKAEDRELFATYISRKYELSFSESKLWVDGYIRQLKTDIFNTGTINLPRIGSFRLKGEKIQFESHSPESLFPLMYGFEKIKAQPVYTHDDLESNKKGRNNLSGQELALNNRKNRKRLVAAAILIPLALGITFSATDPTISNQASIIYRSSIGHVLKSANNIFKTNSDIDSQSTNKELTTTKENNFALHIPTYDYPIEHEEEELEWNIMGSEKYVLSIGVFGVKANAKRLIKKYKTQYPNLRVLPYNERLVQVATDVYYYKKTATEAFSELKKDFPNAWMHVVK